MLDDAATGLLTPAVRAAAAHTRFIALPPDLLFDALPIPAPLTPREWSMVWRLMQGWDNEQIASSIGILVSSVETYWKNITGKLKCSKHELRAWAHAYLRTRHLASSTESLLKERTV